MGIGFLEEEVYLMKIFSFKRGSFTDSIAFSILQMILSLIFFWVMVFAPNTLTWLGIKGLVAVTMFLIGMAGLYGYLNSKSNIFNPQYKSSNENSLEIINAIEELTDKVKNIGTVKFETKDIDNEQIVNSLKASLDQKLSENLFKIIDDEFVKRDERAREWINILTNFNEIRRRLGDEISNLTRRANLNLVVGTATTMLAVIGLIFVVFWSPLDLTNVEKDLYAWKIVAHYVPRLSLIIFVEIFAYFFLRLYKSCLVDIKYYQNELTNVELKMVSLKTALASQEQDTVKMVIAELSKTERNSILKKDETTIELEKFKAEHTGSKEFLDKLSELVKLK